MSKSNKVYLIYAALGLIPLFLILFLDIDPITGKNPKEGSFLGDFTNFFQYPLYMGFALVGFLCFKINQNRMLFSVLLFLGISILLINPNIVLPLGIEVKSLHYAIAMSFPLTLAIIFSIRETRPMDFPNFGRLLSSLLPLIVLGYLAARDIPVFSKIAVFEIFPGVNSKGGFFLPQLALVSLAIFGFAVLLQRDRIVKSFVRVLGISMIPLMGAIWAGLKMYWVLMKEQPNLNKLLIKYPDISLLAKKVPKAEIFLKNFVDLSYPSLHVVAAFTVICAILLHVIFQMYWHRVYVDELTDIPNRRALDERLSHLSGEYAIAMMDIDHFKSFNDNYGHDEGDNVLRLVGSVLSQELGENVYRYGGEEFCAVFVGVSAEDAYMYANKVRRKLEERNFYIRKPNSKREPTSSFDRRRAKKNGKKVQITISIGLANPNSKNKTSREVVDLADKALYEAKRKGRNRVIVWEIEGVKSAV